MAGLRLPTPVVTSSPDLELGLAQAQALGSTQLGRGFDAGRLGVEANYLAAEEAALRAAGRNEEAAGLRRQIGGLQRRASIHAPTVQRVEDVNGAGEALDYGLGQVGQGAASMLDPLAAGVAIGGVATAVSPIARAAARVGQLAAPLVGYGINQRQLTGEFVNTAERDPTIMAGDPAELNARANQYGAGAAVLDTILPAAAARRLTGGGLRAATGPRLGAGARTALDVAGEAGTETAQQFGQQQMLGTLNPERDTTSDRSDLLNAAVGGAIGSGPIAAGSNLVNAGFERVGDSARDIGTKAGQTIDLATGAVTEAAGKARPMLERLKGKAQETVGKIKGQAESIDLDQVREQLRSVPGTLRSQRDERKLLSGDFEMPPEIEALMKAGDTANPVFTGFVKEQDTKRQELVSKRLTEAAEDGAEEATQFMDRLSKAPAQEKFAVIDEAGQWLAERSRIERVERAGRSLLERFVGGAGKKSFQGTDFQLTDYDQWAQQRDKMRAGMTGETERAQTREVETREARAASKQRAELAAAYMATVARDTAPRAGSARNVAADAAFTITEEAQRAARFGMGKDGGTNRNVKLNRLAGRMQDLYGDRAPEVLATLKDQLKAEPGSAEVLSYLGNELARRTPEVQEQDDDALAQQLVGLVPPEAEKDLLDRGINIRDEDGRDQLLATLTRFVESGRAENRNALNDMFGKDAVDGMLKVLGEARDPDQTAERALEEDTDGPLTSDDLGDAESGIQAGGFEERMAQKRLARGESPATYVYKDRKRRIEGDKQRSKTDDRHRTFEPGVTKFIDRNATVGEQSGGGSLLDFALKQERERAGPDFDVEAVEAERFLREDLGRDPATAGEDLADKFVIRVRRAVPREEGRLDQAQFERLLSGGMNALAAAEAAEYKGSELDAAKVLDERNVIFFQHPTKEGVRIPFLAGELSTWGRKRRDEQLPEGERPGGPKEFIAGLMEGIGAVLDSGLVGEGMPYRVTAQNKKQSFAKGIPPSLRVSKGKTAGQFALETRQKPKKNERAATAEADHAERQDNEEEIDLPSPTTGGAFNDANRPVRAGDSVTTTRRLAAQQAAEQRDIDERFPASARIDDEFRDVQTRTAKLPKKAGQKAPALSMAQRREIRETREALSADGSRGAKALSKRIADAAKDPAAREDLFAALEEAQALLQPAPEVAGSTQGKSQSRSGPAGSSERKLSLQGTNVRSLADKRAERLRERALELMRELSDEDLAALQDDMLAAPSRRSILPTALKDDFREWLRDGYSAAEREELMTPERQAETEAQFLEELVDQGGEGAPLAAAVLTGRMGPRKLNTQGAQMHLSQVDEIAVFGTVYRVGSSGTIVQAQAYQPAYEDMSAPPKAVYAAGETSDGDYFSGWFDTMGEARTALAAQGIKGALVARDDNLPDDGGIFNAQRGTRVATDFEIGVTRRYVEKVLGQQIKVDFEDITGYAGEYIDAESAIKLSTTTGPGVLQTAYHEALHALWARLGGHPDVRQALAQVTGDPTVLARIQGLLANEPAALAQLSSAEERAAYAYQFWSAGLLRLGKPATTLFQKIKRFLRTVLGRVRDTDRVQDIFEAFHTGKLRDPSAAGKVLNEIMARGRWPESARRRFDKQLQWLMKGVLPSETVLLNSESAAARQLAREFFTAPGDAEAGKFGEGYLNARRTWTNRYLSLAAESLRGLEEQDLEQVVKHLQRGDDVNGIAFAPHREAVKRVRALLGRYYTYATEAGLNLGYAGETYYPRVWDVQKLYERKADFIGLLLSKYGDVLDSALADARADDGGSKPTTREEVAERMWSRLVDRSGVEDKLDAQRSDGVLSPFFESQNGRDFAWLDAKDIEPFLDKNLVGQLTRYFRQGVRAAEYTRRFGRDGEKLAKLFDGEVEIQIVNGKRQEVMVPGKIQRELEAAAPDDLSAEDKKAWVNRRMSMIRESIGAMEGTLGKDISPAWRKATSYAMVYQNLRLLPLALFSSIVDPLGIVARGGTMNDAYDGFLRGMREVVRGWRDAFADQPAKRQQDQWERLAESIGAVDSQHWLDSLGEAYASEYLDEGARRINNKIFMLNGMESWNRAMRVQATKSAVMFIERHASLPEADSKRWLEELGLTPLQVNFDANGRLITDPHQLAMMTPEAARQAVAPVHYAINRWVEGAILTPNAAQRPAWASDPHWAFMFHLKQFTYSFHQTILRRAVKEMEHGNLGPIAAFIWYVPVMIAADITKGLIQGGGELPSYMKAYDAGDWVMHGVQRAGLLGVGQMGVDANEDLFSILGPSIEQVTDAIQDPADKTLVRALPANALYREALQ
jgi:uncharacterized protein YjbJ (UPF0337 family)